MPSILDPLPDVALHVVKPERVRLERADRRRLSEIPPASTAVAVGFAVAGTVAPGIAGDSAGARGVFPLRLRQKPVGLACDPREPRGVLLGVIPTHVDCGHLSSSPTVQDSRARACGDASIPLVE